MAKNAYMASDSFGVALDYAVAYSINRDYSTAPEFLESFKLDIKKGKVLNHFGKIFNPTENSDLALSLFSNFAVSVFPLSDATWGAREYITEAVGLCVESESMDIPTAYRTAGLRALAVTNTDGKIVVSSKMWEYLSQYVHKKV